MNGSIILKKNSFMDRRGAAVAALAGLIAITAAGCGGSGGSGSNGSLSLLMSDAPPNLGNVTAVTVTVTKVEVHPGDGTETTNTTNDPTWKTCWQGAKTFNLLSLANIKDVTNLPLIVDRNSLPAGSYDQLRMTVDPASATITVNNNGTPSTQPLSVPSGGQSGLKSKKFTVSQGTNTVLLLDFNVAESVTLQGNGSYQLKPIIDINPLTGTGSVSGTVVDSTSNAPMSALVNVKDASGNIVGSSITSSTDGVFAVHGLLPATYTVEVSAQNHTTTTMTTPLLVQGQTTDVGTIKLGP